MAYRVSSFSRSGRELNAGPEYGRDIDPVVDIEAIVDGRQLHGTGFFLDGYPDLIFTARHVVMSESDVPANSIGIIAWGKDGLQYDVETERFACHEHSDGKHGDADVAVLRVATRHRSDLREGHLTDSGSARIHGYQMDSPINAGRATRRGPWIYLDRTAPTSCSGSPLCTTNGAVIGVFVRDSAHSGSQGKAYAIDADATRDCIRRFQSIRTR